MVLAKDSGSINSWLAEFQFKNQTFDREMVEEKI